MRKEGKEEKARALLKKKKLKRDTYYRHLGAEHVL